MTAGRAVLDPNVLISALLSPSGSPAALVTRWLTGAFELVVSEKLLAELERALTYPKLRSRITYEDAAAFVDLLSRTATAVEDQHPAVGQHDEVLAPGDQQQGLLRWRLRGPAGWACDCRG